MKELSERQKHNLHDGLCECQYKIHCHVPRQWLTAKLKRENEGYTCPFFELIQEQEAKANASN